MTRAFNVDRRGFLAAAAIAGLEVPMLRLKQLLPQWKGATTGGPLSSLRLATTWLNSTPLTESGLSGRVVLVDFCTYTCINWLRSLPYVRAWAGKYRDQGLVVIGVHTPEFEFEQNVDNVTRAVKVLRVGHPLAIDNDYAIWNGFENHYWPARYFIDARGEVRHRQFGEGAYDEGERMIQRLLAETGTRGISRDLVAPEADGIEAAADWGNLGSPENYLGSARTEHFVATRGAIPTRLRLNEWALAGDWMVGSAFVALNGSNGRIVCRFHARDVHLVMGPVVRGGAVRYRVRIDGEPPGVAHGIDVDEQGNGLVTEQRLHQLIRQPSPIVDRTCEIEFLDYGVEAFAFTFG